MNHSKIKLDCVYNAKLNIIIIIIIAINYHYYCYYLFEKVQSG